MTPAAAAPGLDAHDIPALDHIAVAQGLEDALIGPCRIDDAAPGARRVPARDPPGRVGDAVDAHGHHGLRRQHLDLADQTTAAAPAPGAAGVGIDGVAQHPHGEDRIQEFGGEIFLRHQIDGIVAVGVGTRAIADAKPVRQQEELALGIAPAQVPDHVGAVRGHRFAGGGDIEEPEAGRHVAHHGDAAHAQRGREGRLQDRAGTDHHLVQRPFDAGVEQGLRAAQQIGAEDHRRYRRAHQKIDRSRHLIVAVAGVEADVVGRNIERIAQLDGPVPLAIAVDGIDKGVPALGQQGFEFLPQQGRGLVQQLREGARRLGAAEAAEEFDQPSFAQPDRRHGGAGVALDHLGKARVAVKDPQQLLVHDALARHPHRRHDDALLKDFGTVGRQRAGAHAADIVKVRPGLSEGGKLTVGEHGGDEHLVGRMRHGPL